MNFYGNNTFQNGWMQATKGWKVVQKNKCLEKHLAAGLVLWQNVSEDKKIKNKHDSIIEKQCLSSGMLLEIMEV